MGDQLRIDEDDGVAEREARLPSCNQLTSLSLSLIPIDLASTLKSFQSRCGQLVMLTVPHSLLLPPFVMLSLLVIAWMIAVKWTNKKDPTRRRSG